jgi:hypothetical protein
MNQYFSLNLSTRIINELNIPSVDYAVTALKRDFEEVFTQANAAASVIKLQHENLNNEIFHISYDDNNTMTIGASNDLGFIYGIFHISKEFLGVQPFWFWNSQIFNKKEEVLVDTVEFTSKPSKIRFRGWFINDEVLIHKWSVDGNKEYPWIMALEALLRCGGNMVIPGTDKNSRLNRELASKMGLYISHHHAEPLGAEMFARAYPELNASYAEHAELFQKLWLEGIEEQKASKVVWNLGFRGQGDRPFWADSPQYNTPESRGKLISELIKLQLEYVSSRVENPSCCTNLYGEVMELYKEGHIELPDNVIRIWADNGYGKMVTRRQGLHNPRIPALPPEGDDKNSHGIYYHVSFYDLQAANHITMQPNSVDFISRELQYAFSQGVRDYLIVNCSNIKPHAFYLDACRKLWSNGTLDEDQHMVEYIRDYYGITEAAIIEEIKACYKGYTSATVKFGNHEDEHAGDQFYNYTTRILANYWLKGQTEVACKPLLWATGDKSFKEQIEWYLEKCIEGRNQFENLYKKCTEVYDNLTGTAKVLFEESMYLHVKIHLYCLKGAVDFCHSFEKFSQKEYQKSFYFMGKAGENYQKANAVMRESEKDIWKGFYENDCLCDVKQTAYMLKHLMFFIRNIGEGPHFFEWQRRFLYKEEDRRVMLITNMENHLTDEELYEAMKKSKELEYSSGK